MQNNYKILSAETDQKITNLSTLCTQLEERLKEYKQESEEKDRENSVISSFNKELKSKL